MNAAKPNRRRKQAARTAARLLEAVDRTIAAVNEIRKLRKELDRLTRLSLSRQEAKS